MDAKHFCLAAVLFALVQEEKKRTALPGVLPGGVHSAVCINYMVTNYVNYESRESRASCVTAPGIINEKLHLTTNHLCFSQSTASVAFSFSGYLEFLRSFDNLCYIPHSCLVSASDSPSWPTSPWRTRPSRFTTSQLRWTPSPTLILWRAQGLMVVMNMLH